MNDWKNELDVKTALSRICDDVDLFQMLLTKFLEKYRNASKTVTEGIEAGNLADMRIIVHSLKGLLGTVGADNASLKAQALELKLKNEDTNLTVELEDFCEYMDRAVNALDSYMESLN